jgi:hypothetical protein
MLYWIGADDRRIYPLLIAYGASSATTTFACIATVLYGLPATALTSNETAFLLANYVPFFLLPLGMAIDLAFRLVSVVASVDTKEGRTGYKEKGN